MQSSVTNVKDGHSLRLMYIYVRKIAGVSLSQNEAPNYLTMGVSSLVTINHFGMKHLGLLGR